MVTITYDLRNVIVRLLTNCFNLGLNNFHIELQSVQNDTNAPSNPNGWLKRRKTSSVLCVIKVPFKLKRKFYRTSANFDSVLWIEY